MDHSLDSYGPVRRREQWFYPFESILTQIEDLHNLKNWRNNLKSMNLKLNVVY